jgi:hypothetical protein
MCSITDSKTPQTSNESTLKNVFAVDDCISNYASTKTYQNQIILHVNWLKNKNILIIPSMKTYYFSIHCHYNWCSASIITIYFSTMVNHIQPQIQYLPKVEKSYGF